MEESPIGQWTTHVVGSTCVKPRAVANEDAFRFASGNGSHYAWIAIADGVGSASHGGEAAKIAVAETEKYFKEREVQSLDMEAAFSVAHEGICMAAKNSSVAMRLETTLMIGVELQDQFIFGYVGNGAIWHVRGDFLANRSQVHPLPWNAANYLIPHSMEQDGREVLIRCLSNEGSEGSTIPTVLTIQKDRLWGDLILMTSDGIDSGDQSLYAITPQGEHLRYLPESMMEFFGQLGSVLYGRESVDTLDFWQDFIDDFLNCLQQKSLLTDDATVGVFVTRQFLTKGRSHED
jgi:serine/threonine protein phosphatase PrpC